MTITPSKNSCETINRETPWLRAEIKKGRESGEGNRSMEQIKQDVIKRLDAKGKV